ncbi:MAG: cysteine desulfurase family protein [Pirellulales bacterium]
MPIYLDYNATTPIAPAVREAMLPYLETDFGNPSSSHRLGRTAQAAVQLARGQVADLLGASPDEIVFTSGGTEANNLAIKGLVLRVLEGTVLTGKPRSGHLVISTLEHPAVVEPARWVSRLGWQLSVVACDRRGVVDPAAVEQALRPDTLLVSIMHANNEIGTIQPIARIADVCRRRGVLLHIDAAQSAGKVPVRVDELGVDLLSIAGHKVYAPKGVGALYVRRGVALEPLLHGAGHESGRRGGTENVPYIVGLGRAAGLAAQELPQAGPRMSGLRDRLARRLSEGIGPLVTINGEDAPRLPNTLSINFPGVAGSELLAGIDDLCASTGAACHAGETRLSATQQAIGLSPEAARGTVRLSVGWYTRQDEVDRAADLLIAAWAARK